MKAAVFHGPNQPLTIEQVDIDEPQDHEVLVRTAASGVCHSDLHFVEGLYQVLLERKPQTAEAAYWVLTRQEVYREPRLARPALSSTHG